MAIDIFLIPHANNAPQGGTDRIRWYVVTTEAEKPVSGLRPGRDRCSVTDTGNEYMAATATTWMRFTNQLYAATANVAVSNTTTQTSIIGSGVGSLTLPADFFYAGKSLRINASGYYAVNIINDRALRFRIKKGSTVLLDSGIGRAIPAGSDDTWQINALLTGRSGTSVSESSGVLLGCADPYGALFLKMRQNGPVTISNSAEAMDLTVEWPAADVNDTITSTNFTMVTE